LIACSGRDGGEVLGEIGVPERLGY